MDLYKIMLLTFIRQAFYRVSLCSFRTLLHIKASIEFGIALKFIVYNLSS